MVERQHGKPQQPITDKPPLPHERDEATGRQSTGQPGRGSAGEGHQRVARRAAADIAQGQVDTDLHATPGLDAERRDELVKPPARGPGGGSNGER